MLFASSNVLFTISRACAEHSRARPLRLLISCRLTSSTLRYRHYRVATRPTATMASAVDTANTLSDDEDFTGAVDPTEDGDAGTPGNVDEDDDELADPDDLFGDGAGDEQDEPEYVARLTKRTMALTVSTGSESWTTRISTRATMKGGQTALGQART
jgi:hypothetical protein